MKKKKSIELTKEQRAELEEVIKKGQTRARKLQHAHVLLKMDAGEDGPNWSDHQIREALGVGVSTIWGFVNGSSSMGFAMRSIVVLSQSAQRSAECMGNKKRV